MTDKFKLTMAEQIAKAASDDQEQRTGLVPGAISVVLSGQTLVITLHGALSEAEKTLSRSPVGAAQMQEYHRQLFATSAEPLRQEIKRITGVDVREAVAEIEPATGTIQVFLLAKHISDDTWHGAEEPKEATKSEVLI